MSKNSSRDWLDIEMKAFAASLAEGALVLDAGAGDGRYRVNFQRQRYESADFEQVDKVYAPPTYSCDLARIPVEDGRFDAVVFTQVMEHLPDPAAVLAELFRVLKPGGRFFFTAPLWYEEHEKPYDFYRYTQFGLAHLFGRAGFEIAEMRWLEGYMGTVSHQLRLMKKCLPWTPGGYGGGLVGLFAWLVFQIFRVVLIYPLRWTATAADRRRRYTARGLPINYLALLTKPA